MIEIIALLRGIFLLIALGEIAALILFATAIWLFCADRARMIRTAVIPAVRAVKRSTTASQSPQDASVKHR